MYTRCWISRGPSPIFSSEYRLNCSLPRAAGVEAGQTPVAGRLLQAHSGPSSYNSVSVPSLLYQLSGRQGSCNLVESACRCLTKTSLVPCLLCPELLLSLLYLQLASWAISFLTLPVSPTAVVSLLVTVQESLCCCQFKQPEGWKLCGWGERMD